MYVTKIQLRVGLVAYPNLVSAPRDLVYQNLTAFLRLVQECPSGMIGMTVPMLAANTMQLDGYASCSSRRALATEPCRVLLLRTRCIKVVLVFIPFPRAVSAWRLKSSQESHVSVLRSHTHKRIHHDISRRATDPAEYRAADMSSSISKDSPPSYETLSAAPSSQLLGSIQRTVAAERSADESNPVEVARLRRFILYCLCVDYRHAVPNTLSAEDTQHFFHLHKTITYLEDSHEDPQTTPTDRQRNELASYLWRFIHEPCRALGIPAECAVTTVLRFVKFQDGYATYKGCAYGLLHTIGPQRLAEKLWQDIHILLPRLLPVPKAQAAMIKRVNELAKTYFLTIEGVEGSITLGADELIGYNQAQTVSYTLTARGQAYDMARGDAVATARQSSSLSPSHMAQRMLQCIPGMDKRPQVLAAKLVVAPVPPPGYKKKRLGYPNAWTFFESVHLPDLFEDRGAKYNCDA